MAIKVLGTGTLQKMPHVFSTHDGFRQEHLYQQAFLGDHMGSIKCHSTAQVLSIANVMLSSAMLSHDIGV